MSALDLSLPEALKPFVDDQVSACGDSTSSEYVREAIRQDRDCQRPLGLLLEVAASLRAVTAASDCFDRVREVGPRGGARRLFFASGLGSISTCGPAYLPEAEAALAFIDAQ